MTFRNIVNSFLRLIYPERCVLCDQVCEPHETLCEECRKSDPVQYMVRYVVVGKKIPALSCAVPYLYAGKPKYAVWRLKFRNRKEYAPFFAERIAEALRIHGLTDFSVICAVPLSPKRFKKRGYNQSELVARELAAIFEKPYEEYLVKPVDNKIQHGLTRSERLKNVKNVYFPGKTKSPAGEKVLLVDDIITTGATFGACAKILLASRAERVILAAICNAD